MSQLHNHRILGEECVCDSYPDCPLDNEDSYADKMIELEYYDGLTRLAHQKIPKHGVSSIDHTTL